MLCRASESRSRQLVLGIVLCGLALATVLATSGVAIASTTPPRKELLRAINRARAAHGVKRLMGSSALRAVALRHSQDMLARNYFAHTSPSGSTITHRIEHSGFVYGYSWTAGETIAWGSGSYAAASATIAAWLKSRRIAPSCSPAASTGSGSGGTAAASSAIRMPASGLPTSSCAVSFATLVRRSLQAQNRLGTSPNWRRSERYGTVSVRFRKEAR